MMQKKHRRGFTLIELMVVMSIIAVLSVLGLAALMNMNNVNVVDRASEEVISAIREAQNKAISVSDAPNGTIPVAWGIQVNAANKTIQPFYVNSRDNGWGEGTDLTTLTYPTLESISVPNSSYFIFAAPFGKYYSSNSFPSSWDYNANRPNDAFPVGVNQTASTITLKYRTSTKTIHIATNGDVYAD